MNSKRMVIAVIVLIILTFVFSSISLKHLISNRNYDISTSKAELINKNEYNSYEKISELLRINFVDDSDAILDFNVSYSDDQAKSETYLKILYEIEPYKIEKHNYYQLNPVRKNNKLEYLDKDDIDYLQSHGINKSEVEYCNQLFSMITIPTGDYCEYREFGIVLYVISPTKDNNNYKVLISSLVPYHIDNIDNDIVEST